MNPDSNDIENLNRQAETLRESKRQWREVFEHNPAMYAPDRLFEAFYTTKAHGMEMGLADIRAHGGRLWAKPNVHLKGLISPYRLTARRRLIADDAIGLPYGGCWSSLGGSAGAFRAALLCQQHPVQCHDRAAAYRVHHRR